MAIDGNVERNQEAEEDILDLGMLMHDFFRGLKKFWWKIVILAAVISAAVLTFSVLFYSPVYESKASFTVSTSSSSGGNYDYLFDYNKYTAEQMATTFPYILESDLLTDLVKQDLGVDEINGEIEASAVSNSNLFTFSVTSDDPGDALAILQSVINNYPEVSRYVIGNTKLNMIEEPQLEDTPCNEIHYIKRAAEGFLAGLAAGICFIFIYALTRKTIRKEEEIQDVLNVQSLGVVPQVLFKKRNRETEQDLTIMNDRLGDYFREPLRGMALHLEQQMQEKSQKVFMVTSTLPGEGVTTIARNLACALAEMDKKVVLFPSDSVKGLQRLFDGRCRLDDVLKQDPETGIWNLDYYRVKDDSDTMTMSGNMKELVNRLREVFDFIIIDTAPCIHMSEASMAAECSDLVVYVVKQDYAKTNRIMEGMENICSYGVSLAGCVLNQTQMGGLSGYGWGGHYGRYYGGYGHGGYSYGNYGYGTHYGSYSTGQKQQKKNFSAGTGRIEKRGDRQ